MNYLEKVLVASLKPAGSRSNYAEQGEVLVEIKHLLSVSQGTRYGQRTTEFNYKKYPLTIVRPTEGQAIIEHNCQICRAPLEISVRSKKSLMKIITPSAIAAVVGLILVIAGVIIFGSQQFSFVSLVGIMLVLLSAGVLFFVLPMEYKDKGIGDVIDHQTIAGGGMGYAKHGIDQSPILPT
jgi:hypothetical protein